MVVRLGSRSRLLLIDFAIIEHPETLMETSSSSTAMPHAGTCRARGPIKQSRAATPRRPRPTLFPYVVPMFAYVALGGVESYLPSADGQPSPFWYPWRTPSRSWSSAVLAWHYRATWADLRPWPKVTCARCSRCSTGLVVWGLWIGLDGWYPALLVGQAGRLRCRCP